MPMFSAWVVKLRVPRRPAQVDLCREFIEGLLVEVAVWNEADAFVVLGPQAGLVVAEPDDV